MDKYSETTFTCMTQHPGFVANCLNSWVLDVAYLQYQHQLEFSQLIIYRHTAYRQLVRWCWGIVGRDNRLPLPSCVFNKTRKTFPSPNGKYTGFKWPT
ncbi:hypothetical protein LSH36_246g05006 [Paralvinella palmiformis]|uniref:P2X purinoreceptor 7 intracellular domain-containing protein n=1 Tax=Paralvinella palmiformis TaxID=53620 RepID=A0AAD9JNF6_9ANNE|nr:hypothetical protein LSH36_246g05006 [Paralvinella palmiformis]